MPLAEGTLLPKFQPAPGTLGIENVDPIGTLIAGIAMDFATKANSKHDFLAPAGIQAPVPYVQGALPHFARVFFRHDPKMPLPSGLDLKVPFAADMSVNWTIGERSGLHGASLYWDPQSPWYNVFYGAYGVRSHKQDKNPWGFKDAKGTLPDVDEMLRVPEFDYNYLTAGQLGCPPAKRCFKVTKQTAPTLIGGWFHVGIECRIPSGLHKALIQPVEIDLSKPKKSLEATFGDLGTELKKLTKDAPTIDTVLHKATIMYNAYMLIMGLPDKKYSDQLPTDYAPVDMIGEMYFKWMKDDITLAWGALCPRTGAGTALADHILDVMAPHYGVARP